ncbi:hypothetical protein DPEC_G00074890 [Dallia pectoralis]|uniref:Uncharacterized protein n=1 Tax=Dallia pectoralis TaxID=75939 RepID=A0ACC2H3Y9_DALPE|nr:hypothetical protein DPEC_G00074890 [Dallia pectoralis]
MASGRASANRANLAASKRMWSNIDAALMSGPEQSHDTEQPGPIKRNASCEDDLALGIEASLYGKHGVRTVQEFLRSTRPHPYISRWNSLTSATSARSAPLSVMDVLNLWSDDPEEVLLDLGFGREEPDISGRIPARFINNQSNARGINIQVYLDAQKNRMDIENPDVSNRFRQLEVLQQVTTAFSSLVGGPSVDSTAQTGAPESASAETRNGGREWECCFDASPGKHSASCRTRAKHRTCLAPPQLHRAPWSRHTSLLSASSTNGPT